MLSYHMHVTKDITEKMIHNTYYIMKQKQKKKYRLTTSTLHTLLNKVIERHKW